MGKFYSFLLATDLDGTLARAFSFNKCDLDAIEYWKSEGGLFTLATGRAYEYVKTNIVPIVKPNAPIVTLNGAVICDMNCESFIEKSYISNYENRLDDILAYKDYITEFYVYYDMCVGPEIIKTDDFVHGVRSLDGNRAIHKIVFAFNSEEKTIEAMNRANDRNHGDGNVSLRSWPVGLELLGEGNTKDTGVLKLKHITGAKTLICAGDFENDIPMIKCADIGYAVGNALDSVKREADRICAPQSEGAIASIIKEMDNLL